MTSASMFDDLDRRLNDVPLPIDLLTRLRKLPLADDADLERILVDVSVPADLTQRLLRTSESVRARRLSRWLRQAAAAILIFTMGLAYSLAAVAFVTPSFEQQSRGDDSRLEFTSGMEISDPLIQQAPSEYVELETPLLDAEFSLAGEHELLPYIDALRPTNFKPGPASEALLAIAVRPTDGAFWRVTTGFEDVTSRPIERAEVVFGNAREVDSRFWRRTGVLPWLGVASNRSIAAPLVYDDTSYRRARREISAGRLPVAGDIRLEEFLAGIDYGLPSGHAAAGSLLLVAGPSPFEAHLDDVLAGRDATKHWLLMMAAVLPEGDGTHTAPPRLTVEFSAEHVSRHRMLGYAPPKGGGSRGVAEHPLDEQGDPPPFSGKVAIVLMEIELAETEVTDAELGRVRLEGGPGEGTVGAGGVRSISAALLAEAIYRDFNDAPIAWRQATLVALAAELLAGSPFADGASLADVAVLAHQLEPSVSDRPGWRDFIETLKRAQTLRSSLRRAF